MELNHKPKLPPDVAITRKGDKYLFLNPSSPSWVVTNSNGARALKLCNGKRTLKRICLYISLLAGKNVTEQLTLFFHNIINKTKLFETRKKSRSLNNHPRPRIIQLILTNKCNLNCIYCYATDRDVVRSTLSLFDYQKLIDDINKMNPSVEITLTGGEPLIEISTIEIAEYARKQGNTTSLLTNGLLINSNNVERISLAFNAIRISLDGSHPELHDFHRGNGTYNKAIEGLALLDKYGANVQISMTVTRKNISDIERMVSKFGSRLSFQPIFRAGSGKGKEYLSISGHEYYEAMARVDGVNPISYLCSSLNHACQEPITKCAIGDSEISISETGDVYPCHMLHFPEFRGGNLKEQSLENIYYDSAIFKACRNLSVENMENCSSCNIRYICGGACRARSYFEKGRLDAADEFCEYEQLAYENGLFELHSLL